MKNNNNFLLLLLVSLMGLSINGCKNNNSTTNSTNSSSSIIEGVSSSTTKLDSNICIKDFNIVYPNNGSQELYNAIFDLNTNIKRTSNFRLTINRNDANYVESPYEIIIGKIGRNDIDSEYDSLNEEDLIIKSIQTENSYKLLVGGINEKSTLFAINEFLQEYLNENIMNPVTKNVYHNINKKIDYTSIYISNEELKEYSILYSSSLDSTVKTAVEHFINDINKALDTNLNTKMCDRSTDVSNIKKAIFIGNVNTEAEGYSSGLSSNSYNVQVKHNSSESKIYIVGTSNQEILNGLHYFYRTSVINGELNVHKYINNKINSLEQRDPCIVPYNGVYYMYAGNDNGYCVRTSKDLMNWSGPKTIFSNKDSSSFTGIADFWAPECHYYNGYFYLFATYKSSTNNHRGVGIFRSSTPDGNFVEITNGHITPNDWDAIDGTLYIDKEGKPYMVFVHEWTSMKDGNGSMCYAPLSDDFTRFTAEPVEMFKSTDPSWTDECVTDGPWLYRMENGTLLMIWSNFADTDFSGYTIGISKSSNGEITGNWEHYDEPLYWDDDGNIFEVINGGHGMIFKSFEGRTYLALHGPNANDDSSFYFSKFMLLPLVEDNENNTIKLDLIY